MRTRLKKLRKSLNLTQENFAKKLDLNRSGIASIEAGNVNLTERNIKKICREFNANESWLRTGEGEMFNTVQEDKELLDFVINIMADKDEFIKKTFLTLARLSEEEWAVVKKIMKSLQEE
ncbi:helix-turn-helix transcriptional regulator [Clostridium botulinum C/D]|uniref:helix-turn-helix transcriptional regulator n=1 Tax=Clostridium botulinum TaxID=1491 RepID=UPI0002D3998D|nr:helix-turn-helix transcriptional regulator [Clostridium botulinum]KEI02888.1 transcriptional regulator [Clostridium botulinum C/D str. Sp77]KOA76860.1 transcriptional regulator [Clostridium botulinum]KOA80939.1 transcriptional regulator [Clostridium botulinum]KOA88965.1 transcriptional regulator [Clostridium botulinum]KOC31834.1 transcriptional regulator [Clostridium botulinum]